MWAIRCAWAARDFRITAVLKQEPDRITAGMGLGPRVMISEAALAETGLLAPGSRASRRLLVKLPDMPPKGRDRGRRDRRGPQRNLKRRCPMRK